MLPDQQRILRIFEYCTQIGATITRLGKDKGTFLHDSDFQQSISFSLLQIGELAGSLSEELRNASMEEINWGNIRGMRNVIVHHYGKIDFDVVWSTVTEDIPVLLGFCQKYMKENPPNA